MNTYDEKWSRSSGVFVLILAAFQIVPILYAIVDGESSSIMFAHLIGFFVTLTSGCVLMVLGKNVIKKANRSNNFLIAVWTMILCAILGAVPYALALNMTIVDAIFESTSGFSTTGLTVMVNLSSIPRSILLWRAMTQGIGAVFALVYFVRVTYRMEDQYWQGESTFFNKLKFPKHVPNIHKSVLAVVMVFLILFVLQSLVLILSGVSLFHSVTHALSTVSTGGFYFTDGDPFEFGGANKLLIRYITLAFMWLSGLSYVSHTRTLFGDFKANSTLIIYTKVTVIGALLLFLLSPFKMGKDAFESVFQMVSMISSSGFALKAADLADFTSGMLLVAVILALIGGTLGSPSGGMKLNRVSVAVRMVKMELRKAIVPNQAVLAINYNGKLIDKDFMLRTVTVILIWLMTAVIGVLMLSQVTAMTLTEASVIGVGALGNLGMTTLSTAEVVDMVAGGKVILIVLMMLGRIEIIPFMILFSSKTYKKSGGSL